MKYLSLFNKEKILLTLIIISILFLIVSFVYLYFLSPLPFVDWRNNKYEHYIDVNYYMEVLLIFGYVIFVISTEFLTNYECSIKNSKLDEFQLNKMREASRLAFIIGGAFALLLFLVFSLNENFKAHLLVINHDNNFYETIIAKPDNYKDSIKFFKESDWVNAEVNFSSGIIFGSFPFILSLYFSRLIIWLKYR